jgi:hypothetical protein
MSARQSAFYSKRVHQNKLKLEDWLAKTSAELEGRPSAEGLKKLSESVEDIKASLQELIGDNKTLSNICGVNVDARPMSTAINAAITKVNDANFDCATRPLHDKIYGLEILVITTSSNTYVYI